MSYVRLKSRSVGIHSKYNKDNKRILFTYYFNFKVVINKIINDDCTEIPDHYSEAMHQLIYLLLIKDPEKRPSISKIIQTPEIIENV